MCHDLSFSADTVEFITDILPDIILDGQLSVDFSMSSHVLSMAHKKCLAIYSKEGVPHLSEFEWGLVADYMTTPELVKKYRIQMANARAENIFDKKSAWYRLRKNRCLIAVNGIYEHRKVTGFKNKIPYFITLRSGEPMLLPAFYNYNPNANPETGEMTGTFAVLTRGANQTMKQIHNDGANKHRMPIFMPATQALKWINESLSDEDIQAFVAFEIPSEEIDTCPVYMIRTTKERPDGKEKFEAFAYENLPPLGDENPQQEVQASLF